MSFTRKILAGLFAGIAAGLFFGEILAPLNVAGDVFIGLLQMTVLPYIVLSLVVNLGRISWAESRGLLVSAIAVFAVMLLVGSAVLLMTPLAFPPTENASFFSTSLVEPPPHHAGWKAWQRKSAHTTLHLITDRFVRHDMNLAVAIGKVQQRSTQGTPATFRDPEQFRG